MSPLSGQLLLANLNQALGLPPSTSADAAIAEVLRLRKELDWWEQAAPREAKRREAASEVMQGRT